MLYNIVGIFMALLTVNNLEHSGSCQPIWGMHALQICICIIQYM